MKLSFTLDVAEGADVETDLKRYRVVSDEVSEALQKICQSHPGFTPTIVEICTDEHFERKQTVGA